MSLKLTPDAAAFDQLPDSANVRAKTVALIRGCSAATVWRHVQEGLLPKPRKLSPGLTVWNVGELRACMRGEA